MQDFQAQLDEITKQKAEVGICTGKSLQECAQYKATEYPKYTQQFQDVMKQKTNAFYGNEARRVLTAPYTADDAHGSAEKMTDSLSAKYGLGAHSITKSGNT